MDNGRDAVVVAGRIKLIVPLPSVEDTNCQPQETDHKKLEAQLKSPEWDQDAFAPW